MKREEAIQLIVDHLLIDVPDGTKKGMLEEIWLNLSFSEIKARIAKENSKMPNFSDEVIQLIANHKEPTNLNHPEFEDFYRNYLKGGLIGFTNSYIATVLERLVGIKPTTIEGEIEQMGLCPCCKYYSIGYGEAGLWEICNICFWQNDGNNQMSLAKAQANFKKHGVIDLKFKYHVDSEGTRKYRKG